MPTAAVDANTYLRGAVPEMKGEEYLDKAIREANHHIDDYLIVEAAALVRQIATEYKLHENVVLGTFLSLTAAVLAGNVVCDLRSSDTAGQTGHVVNYDVPAMMLLTVASITDQPKINEFLDKFTKPILMHVEIATGARIVCQHATTMADCYQHMAGSRGRLVLIEKNMLAFHEKITDPNNTGNNNNISGSLRIGKTCTVQHGPASAGELVNLLVSAPADVRDNMARWLLIVAGSTEVSMDQDGKSAESGQLLSAQKIWELLIKLHQKYYTRDQSQQTAFRLSHGAQQLLNMRQQDVQQRRTTLQGGGDNLGERYGLDYHCANVQKFALILHATNGALMQAIRGEEVALPLDVSEDTMRKAVKFVSVSYDVYNIFHGGNLASNAV